jgi:hypothetical protein
MASIKSTVSIPLSLNTSKLTDVQQKMLEGAPKHTSSITGVASAVTSLNTSKLTDAQQKLLEKAPVATRPGTVGPAKVGQKVDRGPLLRLGADTFVRAAQGRQLHAIADGMRNGTVSAKEAETLLKGQQEIATKLKTAMADGKLSTAERAELSAMQGSASKQLSTFEKPAATSGGLGGVASAVSQVLAKLDTNGQHQANQVDALANGISNHTVTTSEAGKLLGQQVDVADSRGDADSVKERSEVTTKLAQADKDIARHSKPGTQLDLASVGSFIGVHVSK